MAAEGVKVELHDEEHLLLDNCFYVSGFIPRVTQYEEGNPMHAAQWVSRGGGRGEGCSPPTMSVDIISEFPASNSKW